MKVFVKSILSCVLPFVLIVACQTPLKVGHEGRTPAQATWENIISSVFWFTDLPKPRGVEDLVGGSHKVLGDLQDSAVFNGETCAAYINGVTDYLYKQPADYFIPKNSTEIEYLKKNGQDLLKRLFQIRVTLRERFVEFDHSNTLSSNCTLKIREGMQYSRYVEEYLLDWLVQHGVMKYEEKPILTNTDPFVFTNPKFTGFDLRAGDLMVIRGKSFVSAIIARIGDEEGNFSHIAIVAEGPKGELYVVESLIQTGVIITPLEKWRTAQDARVALFRHPDAHLATEAAKSMYELAQKSVDTKKNIKYDFKMDDDNYDYFFCSEVAKYAYDKASNGQVKLPKFRTQLTKFNGTFYPKAMGIDRKDLFAPYDIEVDPRFELVAEGKFYPLLRQVRLQDAVLQSVYSWIIENKYEFHWSLGITVKAYIAKLIRQFGYVADQLPKYMPMQTIKTTLQFQEVAELLEQNIYKKEKEYYEKKGYLPSFQEMMAFNEAFRKEDCELYRKNMQRDPNTKANVSSKFHGIFRPKSLKSCN